MFIFRIFWNKLYSSLKKHTRQTCKRLIKTTLRWAWLDTAASLWFVNKPCLSLPIRRQPWVTTAPRALEKQDSGFIFFPASRRSYLVPVLSGVIDLFHRARLENIDEPEKGKKRQSSGRRRRAIVSAASTLCLAYSHNKTPSFRLSMKRSPILLPVTSWIHSLSSSSFWWSYFPASWGAEVRGQTLCHQCTFCFILL